MPFKIIDRTADLATLERPIKNKFKWSWLEEKDVHGDFLSDYIRKIDEPGSVICDWCRDKLKYGNKGKSHLKNHAKSKNHVRVRRDRQTTPALPAMYRAVQAMEDGTDSAPGPGPVAVRDPAVIPYGAPVNCGDPDEEHRDPQPAPIVNVLDRKSHFEAFVISFMAENSLPLSMVPKLIEFSKEVNRDQKALDSLEMHRTTASYKLREGVGLLLSKRLVADLKKSHFSMNLDECFSNNNKKVLSILVSYFSEAEQEVVVKHFQSHELTVVNAQVLTEFVLGLFKENDIPLAKLISNLSDSTNYMRGKVSGFETRLREAAPHLLDIDGDICHHIHNAVQKFCGNFNRIAEGLLDDLHTDSKWSPDIREALREVCTILGIDFTTPAQRVAHRWLSVYDVLEKDLKMMKAFRVFYFAWIPPNLRQAYVPVVAKVLAGVSREARERVYQIINNMKKKSLTQDGKNRKERIVTKVLYEIQKTMLHVNLYMAILPLFKSFILTFELKEPMIHRIHDELTDVFRHFLACFMKHDVLKGLNARQLQELDVTDEEHHLPSSSLFVGSATESILKEMQQNPTTGTRKNAKEFLASVKEALTATARYLQGKLPLANLLLRCLSALDPKVQGQSMTYGVLKRLKQYFPTCLTEEQHDAYLHEITKLQTDDQLPAADREDGTFLRLDHWWALVFATGKYPILSQIVKAAISIFTGPQVEQSFSIMNNVLNSKTNSLDTRTFSAMQNIRYDLSAKNTTSVKAYHRKDILRTPVDRSLVFHMNTAYGRYKRKIADAKTEKEKTAKRLKLAPTKKTQKGKGGPTAVHKQAKKIKDRILLAGRQREK
jgi:hypothetical protein